MQSASEAEGRACTGALFGVLLALRPHPLALVEAPQVSLRLHQGPLLSSARWLCTLWLCPRGPSVRSCSPLTALMCITWAAQQLHGVCLPSSASMDCIF